MGRKQITFSVPEGVYKYIENRVNDAGYGTVSEYLRDLVRDDRQRQINLSNSANRYSSAAVHVPPPAHRQLLASAARRR